MVDSPDEEDNVRYDCEGYGRTGAEYRVSECFERPSTAFELAIDTYNAEMLGHGPLALE